MQVRRAQDYQAWRAGCCADSTHCGCLCLVTLSAVLARSGLACRLLGPPLLTSRAAVLATGLAAHRTQSRGAMKSVFSLIGRQQFKTFRASHSPDYKTFTIQHVASDLSHPLHETQKRRQVARPKRGLWWHATTGVDLSKSSCVRAWARRRLRNALREELLQRGFDQTGIMVSPEAIGDRADLLHLLQQGRALHLTGSLRLHVQPALIPAKYTEVRTETGQLIDILLQGLVQQAGGQPSVRKHSHYVQDPRP